VSRAQPKNAAKPTLLTLAGIVIDINFLQGRK
jgi:hypothetical protein